MFESGQSERLNNAMFRMKFKLEKLYFNNIFEKHEFMFLNSLYCYMKSHTQESENGIKATSISRYTGLPKPAVSKMLNGLEQKQLIIRSHSKSDRRVVNIIITQNGFEYLSQAKEYFENLSNLIVDELGSEDSEKFINLMEAVIDVIEKSHLNT